jgi:pantoate--beta-alanine ligase
VAQVVHRLFELIQPNQAIFGQKDYQQLQVIKQFTQGVEIISVPTVREKDGLAMSTRNQYLNENERKIAPIFYQTLQKIATGEYTQIQALKTLKKYFKVDYLEILEADSLKKINDNTQEVAVLSAVYLGKNRLIDNLIFRRNNV